MRDKILSVLEVTRNNALSVSDIAKRLGCNENDVLCEIDGLLEDKLIYCVNSKEGLYTLNPFVSGIFHLKKNGDAYVVSGDKYITIDRNRTFGCLDGDKVLVRITDFDSYDGSIKEIIERHGIIGELKTIKGKRYAKVLNDYYLIDVDPHIVDGTIIGIKVDKTKSSKFYHATLDRVIGNKNAPLIDERKILYENEFPVGFSEDVLSEIKSLPIKVSEEDINLRKDHDLRDKVIFTIDGDDTKDIDDAISLEILDNGNYLLGVHIADVSHYVKENSFIDREARERGTSVYTPGMVNPMYDHFLSNGICSLNPNVSRLAITCQIEIDKNGKVLGYDIFKSVIKSKKKMTYKDVNSILKDNIVPEGYEDYVDILRNMKKVSNLLRENYYKRGMIDFDSSEVRIDVDKKGKPLDISLRNQDVGETLIENFMLIANQCVATYIYNLGVPSIYRNHDYPSTELLKKVVGVLKSYGETISNKVVNGSPFELQKLLTSLKKSKNYDIYSLMILRCMAKASYMTSNYGHYGIGIKASRGEAYTHFTAPIRRYPDTMVHRILSHILDNDFKYFESDLYRKTLEEIAEWSSDRELAADRCEREANKMKMAMYMEKYVGQKFVGRIVGFTMHGMFVQLPNYVEGRVSYSSMDDFYNYNEDLEVLVGEKSKKVYRLGDKVSIEVVRTSKDEREIDFEIRKRK